MNPRAQRLVDHLDRGWDFKKKKRALHDSKIQFKGGFHKSYVKLEGTKGWGGRGAIEIFLASKMIPGMYLNLQLLYKNFFKSVVKNGDTRLPRK